MLGVFTYVIKQQVIIVLDLFVFNYTTSEYINIIKIYWSVKLTEAAVQSHITG